MRVICFEAHHFTYLYQSLRKFLDMDPFEAKKICYALFVGNQDTYYAIRGHRRNQAIYFGEFLNILDHAPCFPYKTIVQLYRSLETVIDSIRCCYLIEQDRTALRRLDEIMATIEVQFLSDYGIEITSPETTYSICIPHLLARMNDPDSCLMPDPDETNNEIDTSVSFVRNRTCRCRRKAIEPLKLSEVPSDSEEKPNYSEAE